MHEDLQRHRQLSLLQLPLNPLKIAQAQFTGQNNALAAEVFGQSDAGGTGDRHLRRGVQGQARHQPTRQGRQAHVLNDQGVDPGGRRRQQQAAHRLPFAGEDQHVEGQKSLQTAAVQPGHDLGQFLLTKVLRPEAGVEELNTEIHRIGTVGGGGLERRPASGWSKQFRDPGATFSGHGLQPDDGPVRIASGQRLSLQNASARARS